MNVNIVGRHVQVNRAIEDHAIEKFSKLDRYFSGIQHVDVVVRLDGHGPAKLCAVEATVKLGQGAQLVGKGSAPEMLSAIDMAESRLEKQIRRFHARLKTRRDRTRASHGKAAPVAEAEEQTYEQIVREMLDEGEE
jgi:ribosomal subunit interface protein